MPKNLVLCADGTWRDPGDRDQEDRPPYETNVLKLFFNLAGTDVPELFTTRERERTLADSSGEVIQHSKYIYGSGDPTNFLIRTLGTTTLASLIT
jgi:hypothetical protein